jgi:hypothetical protein
MYDIIYENGMHIAVGESGQICVSPNNDANWRRETSVGVI